MPFLACLSPNSFDTLPRTQTPYHHVRKLSKRKIVSKLEIGKPIGFQHLSSGARSVSPPRPGLQLGLIVTMQHDNIEQLISVFQDQQQQEKLVLYDRTPVYTKTPPPPSHKQARRVSRKAAPAITPSVFRTGLQGADAPHPGAAPHANPGQGMTRNTEKTSVMRLSPSLQNIVNEAVHVEPFSEKLGDGLQAPVYRDANGPGETTIKYNDALAAVSFLSLGLVACADRFPCRFQRHSG